MVTQRLSTFNFRLSTSFTCFHALTTERKEGKALNDQRTIAKSAGPITSSVHSGGESWNGVENGGERESGSRKERREYFIACYFLNRSSKACRASLCRGGAAGAELAADGCE